MRNGGELDGFKASQRTVVQKILKGMKRTKKSFMNMCVCVCENVYVYVFAYGSVLVKFF